MFLPVLPEALLEKQSAQSQFAQSQLYLWLSEQMKE